MLQQLERKTTKIRSCISSDNLHEVTKKHTKYYFNWQVFLWKYVCLRRAKLIVECALLTRLHDCNNRTVEELAEDVGCSLRDCK
jgi:hypothetical protein